MKKLVLNRETLKVLSPGDATRVQGGRPKETAPFSDHLDGCSVGPRPCTSTCPPIPWTSMNTCPCGG